MKRLVASLSNADTYLMIECDPCGAEITMKSPSGDKVRMFASAGDLNVLAELFRSAATHAVGRES